MQLSILHRDKCFILRVINHITKLHIPEYIENAYKMPRTNVYNQLLNIRI